MIDINKNRNRNPFTFANINLLGKCNVNCYFCLGKDIEQTLAGKNQLNIHFQKWKNFGLFLSQCEQNDIKKLYITGQTADGLQYRYLDELVDYLQNDGFIVGLRTNGYLAGAKMNTIQKMKGEIGYSIHSLKPDINYKIMHTRRIPYWDKIIPASGENVRIAIVLNRYNVSEIYDLIVFASSFPNVRYVQIRRISTDIRLNLLQEDIDLFEEFYADFSHNYNQVGEFCKAQTFNVYGKEVVFWRTVETNCNSLNYFTDGTYSDEYFIIEGYLKNRL
jgi:MoaA/NifB/PqqE/SkfB family radical SAM enzyme